MTAGVSSAENWGFGVRADYVKIHYVPQVWTGSTWTATTGVRWITYRHYLLDLILDPWGHLMKSWPDDYGRWVYYAPQFTNRYYRVVLYAYYWDDIKYWPDKKLSMAVGDTGSCFAR